MTNETSNSPSLPILKHLHTSSRSVTLQSTTQTHQPEEDSLLSMPPSRTCLAILHIRDFIDQVELDPTRPDKALALQLRISLNIPQKDALSDDVEQ
jgi:hypothetical protein